jgi:hypothetical protein
MPFFKKLLNPLLKTAGKVADKLHITPLQKVVSYANTVLNGRDNYPPSARKVIEVNGDKKIKNMVIIRQPIQSFINKIFNGLTFGAFQKKLDELPYDSLFHLRMVITLEDGTRIQIEKADVINVSTTITSHSKQENMDVPINKDLTLTALLNGCQKVLGSNTFSYRAFGNNCQDYQMALLKGSSLDTPALTTFVKQDTSELATLSPALVKVANAATDLGGKMNEIIKGTGIKKSRRETHIVQSVSFDKNQWTVTTARKWLSENGYISSKVDRKLNRLRFRQRDPEQLRTDGFLKYTTHRLPKGIELIITYIMKNPNYKNSIGGSGIHSIRAKGGELVHIDLNSHNITGKGLKTNARRPRETEEKDDTWDMRGGELTHDFMQTQTSSRPIQTPRFSESKIKSTNPLFHNIKTSDIRDLKGLFKQISDEEVKERKVTAKQGKATKARVKREVKALKKMTPRNIKTRGSLESKRKALYKYINI